jgi:membrane fusion protein, copper/silver efflux system
VPRSSIIETGPEAVVYVDQDGGAYAQTPVKIGRRGDQLVEVLSGVKAGDKVVTNGNLLIDGQAEMNRAFVSPATEPMPEALTAPQQRAIQNFITVADAMAAALAADDLTTFTKASEPAMTTTASLTESLADIPSTKGNLAALDSARHFHGSADLQSARAVFHKFIQAATAVLEPLRRAKGFPEVQIWECPMVDQAIPGAPKKARWIQTNSRPGANPFFGADMLECGKEIKP